MIKKYKIKDLDCANCAVKIENAYGNLKGVTSAKVDFAREKVIIEGDVSSYTAQDLEKIAQSIEHQVKVMEEEHHDHEGEQTDRQEIILNIFGVILLIIAWLMDREIITFVKPYVIILFYGLSYVLIGGKVIYRAFRNILNGKVFDEHFLMTLATIGAFAIREYVEAVAVMLFYRIGEHFQNLSVKKSRKNIKDLMDIKPEIAHLLVGDVQTDIHPEALILDQLIVIKPGEKVPVDGVVIKGYSSLDTSSLTGESLPRDITPGSQVLSGSINLSGVLMVKVEKAYKDSTVSKILAFMDSNSNKKAVTEQFITRFAKYYTPIVVFLALFLAFILPFIISITTGSLYQDELNIYFKRALIFLVISCPCALVLSIPLSFFAGIGASSKAGILVKSGSDLENFSKMDHYVFDKTGTLTEGNFQVTDIFSDQKDLLLEYAAHAEAHSNHPIAISILKAYQKDVDLSKVSSVEEIFGKGVKAVYLNQELLIGNDQLMKDNNILYQETKAIGTIIHVVSNHQYYGYLVIKDQIKENAKQLIQSLKNMNKKVTMVTGDNQAVAEEISTLLGIDHIYHQQMPEDKARLVQGFAQTEKVLFIGDGVNDAPVLSLATLGVAMGGLGSDAAIEAADAVIMNDDPLQLINAYRISKKTINIVTQNIIFALGIKGLILILGALGYANMWLAIFADVGVSLLAVMNAMRIFKHKK